MKLTATRWLGNWTYFTYNLELGSYLLIIDLKGAHEKANLSDLPPRRSRAGFWCC